MKKVKLLFKIIKAFSNVFFLFYFTPGIVYSKGYFWHATPAIKCIVMIYIFSILTAFRNDLIIYIFSFFSFLT